jgi:hypothetical protein
VPGTLHASIDVRVPYQPMSSELAASVIELVNAGNREPIGHELFEEAWNQRSDLPRSSLLIGMTAAEVGFKTFIGDLVPDAEWLAFNAPTPPLVQMLEQYLPGLAVRQRITDTTPLLVPKKILDTIRKGVLLRNRIAHAGEDVKQDSLKEILGAVRDLLYLLDFYAGHV